MPSNFRRLAHARLYVASMLAVLALASCHVSKPTLAPSAEVSDTEFVRADSHGKKLIIFIHGVFGSLRDTWRNPTTNSYWFDLMKEDPAFSGMDILLLGYRSPFWSRGMTLEEVSTALLQELTDEHVFDRYSEIYIVSHSMGGLIAQRILIDLDRPGKEVWLRKIRCVVFLSTPANGAPIAELATYISRNPQLVDMKPSTLNSWLQALQNDMVNLRSDRELNNAIFPRLYAAYETRDTHGVIVVSRVYANAATDTPLMPFPLDHQGMAAPASSNDRLYKWVRGRIDQAMSMKGRPSGSGPSFEQLRARCFLVGYDSALAIAHLKMGQDIAADRATINGNLRLLGLNVVFPTDPMRAASSTIEDGRPATEFVANVMGSLRAMDRRLDRAFLLGFFGVISLNTPEVVPRDFQLTAFASESGFDVRPLTGGKVSAIAFLEELYHLEQDLLSDVPRETGRTGE